MARSNVGFSNAIRLAANQSSVLEFYHHVILLVETDEWTRDDSHIFWFDVYFFGNWPSSGRDKWRRIMSKEEKELEKAINDLVIQTALTAAAIVV